MGTITNLKQIQIAEHRLEVGHFVFYSNIIVVTINEGVHINFENTTFPIQLATQIYSNDKPVIYISNRLHSYSIDPIGYREVIELFPNLKALAIVEPKRTKPSFKLEHLFITKPIRTFNNLDAAMLWAEKKLKSK